MAVFALPKHPEEGYGRCVISTGGWKSSETLDYILYTLKHYEWAEYQAAPGKLS